MAGTSGGHTNVIYGAVWMGCFCGLRERSGEAGRPLRSDVSHRTGGLIMAKEIWVRAATLSRAVFQEPREWLCPLAQTWSTRSPLPRGLYHILPCGHCVLQNRVGEKEGSATMSDTMTAFPRSWIPKESKNSVSRTILR